MTNQHKTLTFEGLVSDRPSTFKGTGKDEAKTPYSRTSFQLTEDVVTRTRVTDGEAYEASDRWAFSILNGDDAESQALSARIKDLEIGDRVAVEVAVVSRKGYPQFRVLNVTNRTGE